MHEMKYSDVEWIGEIPAHWIVEKFKLHLVRNEPRNPGNVPVLSLYRELGIVLKDSRNDNHNTTSEDTSNYKFVRKGDFVINKMKSWQGSVAVSNYDGIVSPAYFIYNFTDNAFYKLYFHYLLRGCYKDEFMRLSGGIRVGQWDLSSKALENVPVLIPPIDEQQKIADYLDEKCNNIDYITSGLKKQTETLKAYKKSLITEVVTKSLNPDVKMKDSGIEWIGEIPEHWEVKKLKYSCRTRNEKYKLSDGKLDYFALENIISWDSKYIETESIYQFEGANLCYKGDVVFGKLRPYLAKTFLVDYDRCCSSEFAVFCNFQGVSEYYLYLFTEQGFINTVDNSTYGVKMPRANIEFIENMFIPVPPIEEQKKIADYLDEKCTKIDRIISEKKQQIEIIEEYKKSLIYEVVTGKKEI